MTSRPCVSIQLDIESDASTIWQLLAGYHHWAGLFPHIVALEALNERDGSVLIRTRERRTPYLLTTVTSSLRPDGADLTLQRLYHGQIVELWCVVPTGDGRSQLNCEVIAGSAFAHLRARLMTVPRAGEMAEMVALLAEADSLARSGRLFN